METLRPTSGFTSEASLSGNHRPHTPPYTPHRNKGKRRLERSDSPASTASLHPAETSSPAKKTARRALADNVKVEELAEGDVGYHTDANVVYPESLEEVGTSDGDDELSSTEDDRSDAGLSRRLSRLRCGDENAEAKFEQGRRQRRLSKRIGSRVFKRSHSQSIKSDTEVTDVDAMGDQDLVGSQRRLRRKTRGPEGADVVFEDVYSSSAEAASLRDQHAPPRTHSEIPPGFRSVSPKAHSPEQMDVDDDKVAAG